MPIDKFTTKINIPLNLKTTEKGRTWNPFNAINRRTKHYRSINLNNRNTVESTNLHWCETLLDSPAPAHARNTITLLISTLYSRFNHTKHSPHIRSSAINLFPPASAYFPIRLNSNPFSTLLFSSWKSLSVLSLSRKGIKRKEKRKGKKRKGKQAKNSLSFRSNDRRLTG